MANTFSVTMTTPPSANLYWRGATQLPAALVAGGGTAYLRIARIAGRTQFRVFTSAGPTDADTIPGPELTPAWERSVVAVTLSVPASSSIGESSIVVKGPNNPDVTIKDPIEPYRWTPDNITDIVAWLDTLASTDRVTITLSDGLGVPAAGFSLGTPYLWMRHDFRYQLLIDWDGSGAYSDEWDRVESITKAISGRDYASQVFGKTIAGEMELTLRNDDGRYSPGNPASPLREHVRVQRPIGLQVIIPPTADQPPRTWSLWWGLIDNIDLASRRGHSDNLPISALGAISLLSQRSVSTGLRENISVADAVRAVLDAAELPAAMRGDIGGARVMRRWWTANQHPIDALHELEETEEGFVREQRVSEAGTAQGQGQGPQVVFEDGVYRITGDRRVAQFRFSDDISDTDAYQIAQHDLDEQTEDIANIIQVPLRVFDDSLAQSTLWSLPQTVELAAGASLVFVARYPTASSPANHLGVRSWTALAAQTDYQANAQADGLGADRTSLLSVSATDTATSRRIEVTNTSTATDAALTLLQTRGVPLVEDTPAQIEVRDEASIRDYGPLPYPLAAQFLGDADDAVSYGSFTLRQLAQPRLRGRLLFDATDLIRSGRRPPDLSNRVTVSLDGVETDMFIESVNHRLRRGGRHLMELLLSPAEVYSQIIVLAGTYPAGHARAGQVETGGPGLDTGILAR